MNLIAILQIIWLIIIVILVGLSFNYPILGSIAVGMFVVTLFFGDADGDFNH